MVSANCPNCGAPVQMRWSGAVQTTCPFCNSILVRRDVNFELVGKVGDLPADASPIQIATEGTYAGKTFTVVGRIIYEYENGGWNEWHIIFSDGVSGWLSDAQLEYTVSFLRPGDDVLPPGMVKRGASIGWDNTSYEVTVITRAHYKGVEGELPFEYWDKKEAITADLRTADERFATIDYSQQPPALYMGAAVNVASLQLKNLREFEGWQ